MRRIDKIVIHCAATKASMDIGRDEIDRWHKQRGWKGVGYHYVIRRDGTVESGRPIDQVGAHAVGHNTGSIGICLVGGIDDAGKPKDNFTAAQWKSLVHLVKGLKEAYNVKSEKIIGHNQVAKKACPCFSVPEWRKKVGM